ncbi:39S ribosomal protein L12, mitochondrial-like [Dreissena polymorpha]|uniref:39S ribosomal protein L12, mitochondrial n=1 Tax=Dreissena polymorpha TaxID=45954 RepID=A0A9D4LTA4_DREPO|nr:39S ribosomal protein L12, mitochondrial-like [Dreissena polymorpha]KAH3863374.1 hypothetical protein DPMN_026359 [Dreissena polymorpha]
MNSTSVTLLKSILKTAKCNCRHHYSSLYRQVRTLQHLQRCYSTDAQEHPLPLPNTPIKTYSPKIQKIVNDISQLTLLEVSDLNELLKKTLNIADAPMMAMGVAPVAVAPAVAEVVEEAAPQKMSYTVKLIQFDAEKKVNLIKEIKTLIAGTNLVQAKKIVESAPVNLKSDLTKDEAEKLVKALEAVGGKASIE